MVRHFVVANGGNAVSEGGLFYGGLGFVFMLGMIVMSLSIISMIILGCADGAHDSKKKKKRRGGGDADCANCGEACVGCAGCGGGDGGGGCGGGGGGGCGGGGGAS
ncbi:Uncharacterized protein Fot_37253 [Forsythia ovata]|uniref:Uncharacterized protein n=1 Tax=Forsythia ovata TaxID=205694 RepID=A0ABD1SRU1_9LAMI